MGDTPLHHQVISIHAPREGCDKSDLTTANGEISFQSTHPVRGATPKDVLDSLDKEFQSTHPVRGATTKSCASANSTQNFNPRTP